MSLQVGEDNVPFIQLGSYRIRLEKEELDQEMRAMAERELRETPETVRGALQELRGLIRDEPGFYVPAESEEFLIKFLRPSKFYAGSAFAQMKRFYMFKKKHPLYCEALLPSRERNLFSQGIIAFQEVRDDAGCRIMTIHSGSLWVPRQCSLLEMFRGIQLCLEAAMVEPRTQVAGVRVLLDMQGFSLTHVVQFTPSFAKMVVDWIQECIPIRLKGVHIVNQPYIFNMVFAIFKPFLREKLRKRIHFHGGDRGSLHKGIPPRALLPQYGGSMEQVQLPKGLLGELLCKYEEDFILADSYGYDKSFKGDQ